VATNGTLSTLPDITPMSKLYSMKLMYEITCIIFDDYAKVSGQMFWVESPLINQIPGG
jgi:hypothetical protein